MKFRYIIPAVLAATAMLSSSSDNEELQLDNIKVSQTYIAIPENGGEVTVDVTASEAWTFDIDFDVEEKKLDDEKGVVKYYVPTKQLDLEGNSWFSVSTRGGEAGNTKVTFRADATTDTRTSSLQIKAGDKIQNIIVSQTAGKQEIEVCTVKDVIAGVDNKTYRVKGSCSAIASTSYGNFYMTDAEGNSLYIYGTKDATGSYNWNSFNIAIGDEVTVEGPRTTYGSTIELVDATFISVKKALLSSKDIAKVIGKEAAPFTLTVAQKGEGLSFESKSDWLSIEGNGYAADGKGNYIFTVNAGENTTGATRTGSIVIKSTKGSDYTELPVSVTQLGTTAVEEGGIKAIKDILLTATSSKNAKDFDHVLKNAKVTYKNGSNIFIEDETGGLLIYSSDVTLKVGQVVNGRVWGKGYAYNNLPEATAFNLEFAKVTTSEDEVKPTEVTLAQLASDYDKYMCRWVKVTGATAETAIDVKYSAVTSAGTVSDGTNTFALNHQSTGKFDNNKIYYYVQAAAGSKVDVTCIPSVYKTNKQLNIYEQKWVVNK